jgi:hypothetical protein
MFKSFRSDQSGFGKSGTKNVLVINELKCLNDCSHTPHCIHCTHHEPNLSCATPQLF